MGTDDFQRKVNRILKPGHRPWSCITDEKLLKAVAAWNWLQEYCNNRAVYDEGNVGIGGSTLSRLLRRLTVAHKRSVNCFYAMMGNYTYAGLGVQLSSFSDEGRQHFTFDYAHRRFEFIYVTDPLDWEIVPFQAVRLQGRGVVMQQNGDHLPLIRDTLCQKNHDLSEVDLVTICKCLHVQPAIPAGSDPDTTLEAIAKHFCATDDGQSAAVQNELQLYMRPWACNIDDAADDDDDDLLSDPIVEAVFDELNDDDKGEFPEIREAKVKRKIKEKLGAWHDELAKLAAKKKKKRKKQSGEGNATKKPKKGKSAAKAKAAAVDGHELPLADDEAFSCDPEVEADAAKAAAKVDGDAQPLADEKALSRDPGVEAADAALDALGGYSPTSPDEDDDMAAPVHDEPPPPLPPPAESNDSDSDSSSSSSSSSSSGSSNSSTASRAKPDGKVHNYGNCTEYDMVNCHRCGELAGRFKLNRNAGNPDGETWVFMEFSAKDRHTA